MPRHGSVKVRKMMPKGSAEDANMLNDMFSQMTGSENADPDIIIPKLCNLNNLLIKYSKVYKLLLTFKEFIDNFPECESNFTEISKFIESLENIITDSSKFTEEILKSWPADNINALYKQFKINKAVQDIIITSSNLGKYKRYLIDINNLGDDFIKREPGLSFKPIAFTGLEGCPMGLLSARPLKSSSKREPREKLLDNVLIQHLHKVIAIMPPYPNV